MGPAVAREAARSEPQIERIFMIGAGEMEPTPESGGGAVTNIDSLKELSDQLAHNLVVYPKVHRVIINEHGAFIPRSLFSPQAELRYRESRAPDGKVQSITVFTEAHNEPTSPRRPSMHTGYKKEISWLDEHRQEFIGQWVALDGNRLLGHGTNAREVFEVARRSGVELPLVVFVDPADELPFGGW
jgi:hypothetical protein